MILEAEGGLKIKYRCMSTAWIKSIDLELPHTDKAAFTLQKETLFDKFSKKIKYTSEIQTGDLSFDRKYYVSSDTAEFTSALLADDANRRVITSLFENGVREINADEGTMKISMISWRDPSKHEKGRQKLHRIAHMLATLSKNSTGGITEVDSHTLAKAQVVRGVHVCAMIFIPFLLVAFAILCYVLSYRYEILQPMPAFIFSLKWSMPFFCLLWISLFFGIKGSAVSHKILLAYTITLLPLNILVGYTFLIISNAILDNSSSTIAQRTVLDREILERRRYRDSYYVIHPAVTPNQDTRKTKVEFRQYRTAIPNHSLIELEIRAGYFDFPWIARREVITKNKANPLLW